MKGLNFQVQETTIVDSPNRMDIACFVGFVDYRPNASRDDIDQWLFQQSWVLDKDPDTDLSADYLATYHRESAETLRDVPVPIESWERFRELFAWNERDYGNDLRGAAYLAAAVRSFFAQGGRKCYVVRVGSPADSGLTFAQREALLDLLVPGFANGQVSSLVNDRKSWHGVGHVLGLPEVTMLCLPDLPDLLRADLPDFAIEAPAEEVRGEEQFVECSEPAPVPLTENLVTGLSVPCCAPTGYINWAKVINQVALFISRSRRDIQLVAAVPLPTDEINNLFAFLHKQKITTGTLDEMIEVVIEGDLKEQIKIGIASAFVQLVYPWLKTSTSSILPQGIEPPDGRLAGMLASNAISRGAFRSITAVSPNSVSAVFPKLSRQELYGLEPKEPDNNAHKPADRDSPKSTSKAHAKTALVDRVSIFGNNIDGISLLSDVTTSNRSAHRPANVNRIISMVLRATRQAGETYVFENNGEVLWAEVTQGLNSLLDTLFRLGALRGKLAEDAYFVRCDRSTMSQQDIDSGRLIAIVHFEPAASIESIDVVLNLRQNSQLPLQSIGLVQAVA